jgi:glycogen operon protein
VHAEHAESVTLLLYAATDLINPLLSYRFDFLRNKSGRIWHCRIPLSEIGEARFYGYSVSGEAVSSIHSFDPQKVLLDPYAKCVFFPPGFDRKLAMREGSNVGKARSACCPRDTRTSTGREAIPRITSRTRLFMSFM